MSRAKVEIACRDCKKCINSGMANASRNTGRAFAGLMTMGMSEVGMKGFSKKCRTCGHQLSLHKGADARTPQPAFESRIVAAAENRAAAAATPLPRALAPSAPPAGWYNDPQGTATKRWWDGNDWTEHTTDRRDEGAQRRSRVTGRVERLGASSVVEAGVAGSPSERGGLAASC